MTAYEIISQGFALAGESPDNWPDKKIAISWLNRAVAEAYPREKLIRERKGDAEIEMQYINSISDVVDMDSVLCRVSLPLCIAEFLFTDRENNTKALEMRERFIKSLSAAAGSTEKSVEDCYGGAADVLQ